MIMESRSANATYGSGLSLNFPDTIMLHTPLFHESWCQPLSKSFCQPAGHFFQFFLALFPSLFEPFLREKINLVSS